MIFKHNTAIINDIIIEQNIKNFDPRWISRGAYNSEKKIWIMNIPKNASNSIGRLIAPGNRPRPGWLTEQRYSESGKPDHNFFVVLRNPLERFYGSLAQHYIIQMERDVSLTDINQKIDNLDFMSDIFDDIHIWPQFCYLHGLPVEKTTFLDLKNIKKLPGMVGIADDIESWNVSDDNPDQKATKQRIRVVCETNPDVMSVLQEYYATDLEIIEKYLGYVPIN